MRKHCEGMSLLEVAISLAIFTFGLLALAKAQVTLLSYDHQSYATALATIRIQSLADLMQVDPKHISTEVNLWNQINQELLPGSKGYVTGTNPYFIYLSWKNRQQETEVKLQVQVRTHLNGKLSARNVTS